MEIGETVEFEDRDGWRSWLEENHDKLDEIWLVTYKKHTGKPTVSYDEAVEEALCFGWIDSMLKRVDDERTALRYTPRKPKSNLSDSNRQRIARLIKEGRMTEAGLSKVRHLL